MNFICKYIYLIIGLFLLEIHAKAQIKFGIEYGINFLSFDKKLEKLIEVNNLIGFEGGPVFEIKSPLCGIHLRTALLYSQQDIIKAKEEDDTRAYKVKMLEIPVGLKCSILPFSNVMGNGIFLLPGVYIDLKLDDDIPNQIKNKLFNSKPCFSYQYGSNIGIEIDIFNHLQLGINCKYGLTATNLKEQFLQIIRQVLDGVLKNEEYNFQVQTWNIFLMYLF